MRKARSQTTAIRSRHPRLMSDERPFRRKTASLAPILAKDSLAGTLWFRWLMTSDMSSQLLPTLSRRSRHQRRSTQTSLQRLVSMSGGASSA